MLRTLFLLLLPCFFILADEDIIPYMTSECDTYALVDGVVNAHNGKLVQIDQDIKTGGVDPVEMVRYYDGGHHFDSQFGYGVGSSYPALLKVRTVNNQDYVIVELRDGLEVLCEMHYSGNGVHKGSLSKLYYTKGYTNCPSHLLQGEPSLFALEVAVAFPNATVKLGDGTIRHYVHIRGGDHYRLYEEVLPSGNRRHFFYTRNDFPFYLKDICTTNADRTLNLNWLKFTDTIADTKVVASNGQETTYKYQRTIGKIQKGNLFRGVKGKIERDLIFQVHLDNYPHTEYQSTTHSKSINSVFSIYQVHFANRVLEVEYDGHERVKILKSAASPVPLYTFHYRDHSTDVTDANGAKKTYSFSNRRLISLTEPHRTQNYHWDEKGQLISHTIHTPDGAKHFEQNYCYDAKGNVTGTEVIGNITAAGSYECHSTRFLYDPTSNHLLSIKRNHDHETIFSYIGGTNLISFKLTLYKGRGQEREYYNYDKNGILIQKVVDDGEAWDSNDFTNTTYRLITEIEPQLDPNLPGMTQPRLIKESYVDIATGEKHPLKTTECLYTQGDLIAEKRIFDAEGVYRYTLYYEYNHRRELVRETNALGESTLYGYDDAANKIYEEKVGSGKKTQFTYDLANRLIEEREIYDDRQLVKRYSYDPMGNRIQETDIYGRITQKKYDLAGREILSINPAGCTEEKSYDLFGNVTVSKDKDGYFTTTAYNIFKKPLAIVYPDNTREWFAYDLEGQLIKEWKRDNTLLSHELDYKGRVTKTEVSKEGTHLKTLQYIYKGPHLIGEIDALGNQTDYRLDGAGRTIEKIEGPKVTRYAYDSLGRLVKTTIDGLSSTCIEYDLLDRKIEERVEDLSGNIHSKVQFEYDALGNQTVRRTYLDASSFSETRTRFNGQNLPILEIDPLGFEKRISYSQTDHLEKETIDALGRRTLEVYDPLQRPQDIKKFSPDGTLLAYNIFLYDSRDNMVHREDYIVMDGVAIGTHTVQATYDGMNQKVLEIEQGGKVTKWEYYQGKLIQLTTPDQTTISYTYNPFGQLIEQKSSDGTLHDCFAYDLNDNLIIAHNRINDSYVERAYDTFNRLTFERQRSGLEFYYTYDNLDRIKEMRFCGGSITYDYSPTTLIASSRYQGDQLLYSCTQKCNWRGKVIEAALNTIPCAYEWDLAGRCTAIKTPFYNQQLSYDPLGNLIASTGTLDNSYEYDELNQLTKETGLEYAYDSLNNRRRVNETPSHLDPLNQVTQNGDDTYRYDANGRRTHKNDTRYSYDALGRLLSFNDGEITYQYDALGRRIKRTQQGLSQDYLYQMDTEIGLFDKGLVQFRHIQNKFSTVALELENKIYFPIRNHRGDIVQLLDMLGNLESTYTYDAFGNFTSEDSLVSPWLFCGQRYEPITNLYHFDKRDYDPHLGRWLTCDPLGFADGPNLYAYVHNNPLIYIDPYGLLREESKDFLHGFSRGAADDTTWGATSLAWGDYESTSTFGSIGYHVGTGVSLLAGLTYGATEAKAARFVVSLFRRALQKTHTRSLKAINSIKTVSKLEKTQVPSNLAKLPEKLSVAKEGAQKACPDFILSEVKIGGNASKGWVDLRSTIEGIKDGTKFPHRNDGSIFKNREGLLPKQSQDYYREFVHPTPGITGAGPQRIIRGQNGELFYTPDHYQTFIQFY